MKRLEKGKIPWIASCYVKLSSFSDSNYYLQQRTKECKAYEMIEDKTNQKKPQIIISSKVVKKGKTKGYIKSELNWKLKKRGKDH